jgi:hypothetical protein
MDVIEFMGIHPRIFCVVDLEMAVRRYVIWLDGGEIRSFYDGGRELFREFYGPDSGSCCDV